jgi:hypothetical protein
VNQLELEGIVKQVIRILTDLGFSKKMGNGEVLSIHFDYVAAGDGPDGEIVLMGVNQNRLPPGTKVSRLRSTQTLRELTQRLNGWPVGLYPDEGQVIYVVQKIDPALLVLPERCDLDLNITPRHIEFAVPIGANAGGVLYESLLDLFHFLIGGETQSGKSTFINALLATLIDTYGPEHLQLRIIDPKVVEFACYAGIPHLGDTQVALEPSEALALLDTVCVEQERRAKLYLAAGAKTFRKYNQVSEVPLPLMVVVIDEVADLMIEAGAEFEKKAQHLAQVGAAFGIILILATQAPSFQTFPIIIKRNCPTRIGFPTDDHTHSKLILGQVDGPGLHTLAKHPGRLMAKLRNANRPYRLQGVCIEDDELNALLARVRGSDQIPDRIPQARRLTELQCQLVRYGVQRLDGTFPVNRIWKAFNKEISSAQMRSLAAIWEEKGLLVRNPNPSKARIITDELRGLAEQ